MNGASTNFQQKTEHGKYIHTTFLSGKFLPFSEMYPVNKEVLKRSSGAFFRCTFRAVKLIHIYVHTCVLNSMF